ncbi:Chromatin structure remodeling complex protein sfh1 [Friedmanniomyces endolithicus]|uniref:Chromatin structure remodeling complex protein sfh1 n=1 Tax=Friedmanniomyces endolithicus TaxID=329885 RepID=A0AAN6HF92_9PEZI|nr:Chromatin structure remodeling complex protein sfh1 [Friedmanniomyces endolithicus]KAK0777192.1 Chromatin structure remodeling complex protein sfh1 [Friedmanniomyces endolithicus]KAK0796373.1 Chromatin structure remodeling complex protein sfh1 [Friedmanniomyces endolithicus]KAK0850412.1 Chromatin structure remodeling complex protein sfh1 [Friedmanniomyces endolithicus]KAK0868328.1 Chromatin structure remodeling complex protein sfh1 [Friedmanniomyces endolithicus]
MANVNRINAPQSFVSSYAPRIRTYGNSLLTPVQPQTVLPQVRTTKRGTTAINYAEEFEDDSIDDSDAPRRHTGLRTQPRREVDANAEKIKQKPLGKEAHAPVDVQGIWREWMGKPKRVLIERQVHVQSALPTTLVPIRIDLDVAPFRPEAALPTPHNAKDFGIDENLPAYKVPEPTPQFRLKDSFLWNLHEALITPDQFAKTFVDELDFPVLRKPAITLEIANSIRQQLEEHASTALHPLFQRSAINAAPPTNAPTPSVQPALSRDDSIEPARGDTPAGSLLRLPQANGHATSGVSTPFGNGATTPALAVTAQAIPRDPSSSSALNPPDSHRCVLNLSINMQNRLFTDKFEWSLLHPPGFPEIFAKQTCADLGLSGEWVPSMAHAIYEASLRLKKDMIDNGGSLAGVVGSGVDGWGMVENEACEFHGTAEPALGVGAGWRFDEDGLGLDWEPKIEVLSKDEIEKREGDRERQLRRARRETARFTTNYTMPQTNDFFTVGLGSQQANAGGEDERMGRGERSKKKRRFRSLSPAGRDTPDIAGFGGTSGQLTEGERQYWRCSHCQIWGAAIWGVRDGPHGPRTLCNNCGLLHERDNRLPPWNRNLFATERNSSSREAAPPPAYNPTNGPAVLTPAQPRQQTHLHSDISSYPTHAPSSPPPKPPIDVNPSAHLYTGASSGQGQISASTMADIINYAEPGEDLDWTQVTEPRERKRLQNIINGRKYRERRLAAEGHSGSGGNYPGAAGVGSYLSTGYGKRLSGRPVEGDSAQVAL